MSSSASPSLPCLSCHSPGRSRCSGCSVAWYCSKECQRAHWRAQHKQECSRLRDELKELLEAESAAVKNSGKRLVPPEHLIQNGRSLLIPPGAPLDLLFAGLGNPAQAAQYDMAVSSPIAVVQAIAALVLQPPSFNLTTAQAIAIAEQHSIHPDSVRLIGRELLSRWKRGDPYTSVTSMHVPDPSKTLADNTNSSQRVFFEHKASPHKWSAAAGHPSALQVDEECVQSDTKNYIYVPQKQTDSTCRRIVIYSCVSKFNENQQRALEQCLQLPVLLGAEWVQSCRERLKSRMLPRVVLQLCAEVVMMLGGFAPVNKQQQPMAIGVFLQREGKLKRVVAPPVVEIDRPAFLELHKQNVTQFRAQNDPEEQRYEMPACRQCGLGARLVRCAFCQEELYCRIECRDAHWKLAHQKECVVFLKQTKSVALPPGGPVVAASKVKY